MKPYVELPSQEYLRELFAYDPETGHLYRHTGTRADHKSGRYRATRVHSLGRTFATHRIIRQLVEGDVTPHQMMDHINGDGQDNRWENLRLVDACQNSFNRKGPQDNNREGLRNVRSFRQGKYEYWRVEIRSRGRTVLDQCFPKSRVTQEEVAQFAEAARQHIEKRLFEKS